MTYEHAHLPDSFAFGAASASPDAFVLQVPGEVCTPGQLFAFFYTSLELPGDFGFNWDALFDCFRVFQWATRKKIVIAHDRLPALSSTELNIYLRSLRDTWSGTAVTVQFSEKDRADIGFLLGH